MATQDASPMRHAQMLQKFSLSAVLAVCFLCSACGRSGPDIESSDPAERIRAIAVISDQKVLADVAASDHDHGVRSAALAKLTDDELLAFVATVSVGMNDTRMEAVKKIASDAVLLELATGHAFKRDWAEGSVGSDIRNEAAARITNPEQLEKLAIESTVPEIAAAAAKAVQDESASARIASQANTSEARKVSAERIKDERLLESVATAFSQDQDEAAGKQLAEKITDQHALARVAESGKLAAVRQAAARRITDQGELATLAKTAKDADISVIAVSALTDQELLKALAFEATESKVRVAAAEHISSPKIKTIALGWNGSLTQQVHVVESLDLDDPMLKQLCGDLGRWGDGPEEIARLKLAMKNPIIRAKLPNLQLKFKTSDETREYRYRGDSISFPIERTGTSINATFHSRKFDIEESRRWSPSFPTQMEGTHQQLEGTRFQKVPTIVKADELLSDLITAKGSANERIFSDDDRTGFVHDSMPEMRAAAAHYLSDRTLLNQLATSDPVELVKTAAKDRIAFLNR